MADDGQENRLIAERRAKLARLRHAGKAYPNDFHRDALADELLAAYQSHSAESLAAQPVTVNVADATLPLWRPLAWKVSFRPG